MNQAELQKLLESSWQRPLSPEEQASLQQWLAAHPQDQILWEEETALNQLLQQWPDVPVPSNFTARVLDAVDREVQASSAAGRPLLRQWFRLHRWKVRLAGALLILFLGLAGFQYVQHQRQENLVRGVQVVGDLAVLPNPEFLNDFEAIQYLATTPQSTLVDIELLAALE